MVQFIFKRLLQAFVVLIGVSIISFVILRFLPGNPAQLMLPENATEEQIENMMKQMGLDLPIWEQYIYYIKDAMSFNFGDSLTRGLPTMQLIFSHLPATAKLVFWAMFFAVAVSIPLGMFAAIKKNSISDYFVSVLALIGQSIPNYWLGIMLILLMSVNLNLLPTSGEGGVLHYVLPVFTLAIYQLALISRLIRSSTLDVLNNDYIRTAKAKGLPGYVVIFKHILKNALLPTLTTIGLQAGELLGGAIITEYIFSWPGIGFLTVQSIQSLDYPMIQSLIIVSAVIFIFINLIIDILYAFIDKRIVVDK